MECDMCGSSENLYDSCLTACFGPCNGQFCWGCLSEEGEDGVLCLTCAVPCEGCSMPCLEDREMSDHFRPCTVCHRPTCGDVMTKYNCCVSNEVCPDCLPSFETSHFIQLDCNPETHCSHKYCRSDLDKCLPCSSCHGMTCPRHARLPYHGDKTELLCARCREGKQYPVCQPCGRYAPSPCFPAHNKVECHLAVCRLLCKDKEEITGKCRVTMCFSCGNNRSLPAQGFGACVACRANVGKILSEILKVTVLSDIVKAYAGYHHPTSLEEVDAFIIEKGSGRSLNANTMMKLLSGNRSDNPLRKSFTKSIEYVRGRPTGMSSVLGFVKYLSKRVLSTKRPLERSGSIDHYIELRRKERLLIAEVDVLYLHAFTKMTEREVATFGQGTERFWASLYHMAKQNTEFQHLPSSKRPKTEK
jgi:hypothetical protein